MENGVEFTTTHAVWDKEAISDQKDYCENVFWYLFDVAKYYKSTNISVLM